MHPAFHDQVSQTSEIKIGNINAKVEAKEVVKVPNAANPVSHPRYWLKVRIGETELKALPDTGAARTIIGVKGKDIAKDLRVNIKPAYVQGARMANGTVEQITGEMNAKIELAGVTKEIPLLIIPALATNLLLGLDFIRAFRMDIFASRDTYKLADLEPNKEFALIYGS